MIYMQDYYREFRMSEGREYGICTVTGCICEGCDCRMCTFAHTAFDHGKSPAPNREQTLDRVLISLSGGKSR